MITGLTERFVKSVEDVLINKISIYPTAFAIRYKSVRIVYTQSFPYAIHFTIDETQKIVTIIAIVHSKRDRIDF